MGCVLIVVAFRCICRRGVGYPLRGVSCRRKRRKRKSARYVEIQLILIAGIRNTYLLSGCGTYYTSIDLFFMNSPSEIRRSCPRGNANLVLIAASARSAIWLVPSADANGCSCQHKFHVFGFVVGKATYRRTPSNLRQQIFGSLANDVGRISLPTSPGPTPYPGK